MKDTFVLLFVVPLICELLTCQPVSFCWHNCPHFKDLDLLIPRMVLHAWMSTFSLAPTCIGNLSPVRLVVGILDQLWLTQCLAVCCQDQFPPLHQMCFLVASSHTFHTLSPHDVQLLDDRLKLESFRISPTDCSVHDYFGNSVHFIDWHYEV